MARNGDILKPAQAGQPIDRSAEFHNATAKVIGNANRVDTGVRVSASRGAGGLLLIRNDTAETVPQFGVLGYSDPVILPADQERRFLNKHVFSGVMPTAEHAKRFVIAQEPIPPGKVRVAKYQGMTAVRMEAATTDFTISATVVPDSVSTLKVGDGGAQIIWSGVGEDSTIWAKVILDATGGGGSSFGLVVAPAVRTEVAGAKPAWIRPSGYPSTDNDHVFIWPSDADGVPIGTPPALSTTTEDQFRRVELIGRGGDPSLFDGEVVRYELTGEKYFLVGDGHYDSRIGDPRRIIIPAFGIGEGRGWFWADDTTAHVLPCSDTDTLGGSVSMIDIRQTLDVEAGDVGIWYNAPHPHNQGEVIHALDMVQVLPIDETLAIGNYARTLVRFH